MSRHVDQSPVTAPSFITPTFEPSTHRDRPSVEVIWNSCSLRR